MRSVLPTHDDPLVRSGSEVAGGPAGSRVLLGVRWWTAARVLVLITVGAALVGLLTKGHCLLNGWGAGRYTHMCYSDIPILYELRGLADGFMPYVSDLPADQTLEYPALTGVFVYLAARISPDGAAWYYAINVVLLTACWVTAVLATSVAHRTRPWDAAMIALAPGIILAGTINWDLLAVALLAVGLALWSRERPVWAGVLIGLATAAKLYPALILLPLALLCWQAGAWSALRRLLAGAAGAWLAVNLPFMLANFDGWAYFYTFSRERGADFGSLWLAMSNLGLTVPPGALNSLASVLMLLAGIGLIVLVRWAPRTPRVGQLAFLITAAFVLTNKVYSPQFVVWLIPLAVLARPRWREFLIWQAAEAVYFVSVWLYLAGTEAEGAKGLPPQAYALAILIHVIATAWFAGLVVEEILRPDGDPIRADGTGVEDPLAGPLAAATGPQNVPAPPPAGSPP